MDTLPDPLSGLFSQPDKQAFDLAILELREQLEICDPTECVILSIRALTALDGASSISVQTCSQRARVILRTVPVKTRAHYLALADIVWQCRPAIRNEIFQVLPPEFRHQSITGPIPQRNQRTPSDPVAPTPGQLTNPALTPNIELAGSVPSDQSDGATVILLGNDEDHEANRVLFRTHQFSPLRATRRDQLQSLVERDVCAIVVAASWWAAHSPTEHEAMFRELIAYSSFIWFKIDITGLAIRVSLAKEIIREIRLADPNAFDFVFGDTARVTDPEIEDIREVQALLSLVNRVRLVNSEISDAETMLLVAATTKCVRDRHFGSRVTLNRIRTRFIQGGRTKAHLVLVEPDDHGVPIIVKIGNTFDIHDEARRFKRFIAPFDDRLRPSIHRHFGSAAIVFGLVADDGTEGPAPTLEQQLRDLMAVEVYGNAMNSRVDEATMSNLLERVVRKLTRLNLIRCHNPGVQSYASLSLRSVGSMQANGIVWTVPTDSAEVPLALHKIVDVIAQKADRLNGLATVHGDIHLRNILCGGQDPHLIDYACSGPGHPCFDLARLESALMFQGIRMIADERSLSKIVTALSVDGQPLTEVARFYPEWMTSVGNRLALKASELVRAAALKVLAQYGGDLDDYLAIKAVFACQALSLPDLQSGVVRATLLALVNYMETRRWDLSSGGSHTTVPDNLLSQGESV